MEPEAFISRLVADDDGRPIVPGPLELCAHSPDELQDGINVAASNGVQTDLVNQWRMEANHPLDRLISTETKMWSLIPESVGGTASPSFASIIVLL